MEKDTQAQMGSTDSHHFTAGHSFMPVLFD
jgi:hypothetical protein